MQTQWKRESQHTGPVGVNSSQGDTFSLFSDGRHTTGVFNALSQIKRPYHVTPESSYVSHLEARPMSRLSPFVKEVQKEEQRSPTLRNPPMMEGPQALVSQSSLLPPLTLQVRRYIPVVCCRVANIIHSRWYHPHR